VTETLQVNREGSVVEIVLSRPDVLNKVDSLAHKELLETFESLRDSTDVRAIVFASTGKVFSAGGDFDFMLEIANANAGERFLMVDEGKRLLRTSLHGSAIGLAAGLVLCCDAIVAHPKVVLSDPHVVAGLVAGDGGCLAWPQSAGMMLAKRHLMWGEPLTAERAFALGLVTDLVDTSEEVLPAARALAHRVSQLPPFAVQGTKRALNAVLQQRFAETIPLSMAYQYASFGTGDLREAVSAFQEKRPGNYQGS
jgi:enoyl-CoA hydratase